MILKNDNLKLGLALGFLVPLVIIVVLYFLRFSYYSFGEFLEVASQESRLVTFFSAWCLVANIGLFTVYINTAKYKTAKGVFMVTIIYGLAFLLLKIIM